MKCSDLVNCSYGTWYQKFKKVTIKSELLELPPNVLEYLLHKGTIVLPDPDTPLSSNKSDISDDEDWPNDDGSETAKAPLLDEFTEKLRIAITRLGGTVFPKLSWSAPKDAACMTLSNTIKCNTPNDVYLLLKSSDILDKDIVEPFKHCSDSRTPPSVTATLVLKRWLDINPSCEFRCFVRDGRFIGFCPRETTQRYECHDLERSSILSDITSFWKESIENRFPLRTYVFDVVRRAKDNVTLLDFSPVHETRTKNLLFEWNELVPSFKQEDGKLDNTSPELIIVTPSSAESNNNTLTVDDEFETDDTPEFRYINDETGVQPNFDAMPCLPLELLEYGAGSLMDIINKMEQHRLNQFDSDE